MATRGRLAAASLAAAGFLALAGCSSREPQTTQVILAPPAPTAMPTMAPAPPPLPHAELVPPPPSSAGPQVWQPGHWRYTGMAGNPWAWEGGRYLAPPPGAYTWVPGRWSPASDGNWMWTEGHWA